MSMLKNNCWRRARRGIFVYLAVVLVFFSNASPAVSSAGDRIVERATAFLESTNQDLGDRIAVTVNTPTARMPVCHDPQPFLPGHGQRRTGRITVGIRCPGDRPATRYVQADVRVFGRYFVARHDIESGATLSDSDIQAEQGDITRRIDRLAVDRSAIVGQQARRRIGQSRPIVDNMLEAADIISRGDQVKIVSRGAGFSITTHGQALDDAAAGQRIRVRTGNGKIIEGTPAGPGRVQVGP